MMSRKNILRMVSLLIFINSFASKSYSQKEQIATNQIDSSLIGQKDLIDIFDQIFKSKKKKNKLPEITKEKKYHFSVLPVIGYTLQSGLVANVSGNVIFKNYKNDSTNTSAIIQGISYTEKNQLEFYVLSDIWSKNNMWNVNTDLRYYIYPQDTYGLGGFSKESDAQLVNFSFLRFYNTVYKKATKNLYLGLGYMLDKRWNITQDHQTGLSDYEKYGFYRNSCSSGISLNVLSDTRDNPINSSKGVYSNIIYRYNTTMLGSDENWSSLTLDFRKYYKIDKKNTILALWNYNWLTLSGKAPYLDLPSTAWEPNNNLGRGYIQSRFRSPNLVYVESELRFNITKNELLGAVIFANAQSFTEWSSKRFERIIPGFGGGLRIKFNKESNTNIAIDYGFGLDGSGGVFINLGEVF